MTCACVFELVENFWGMGSAKNSISVVPSLLIQTITNSPSTRSIVYKIFPRVRERTREKICRRECLWWCQEMVNEKLCQDWNCKVSKVEQLSPPKGILLEENEIIPSWKLGYVLLDKANLSKIGKIANCIKFISRLNLWRSFWAEKALNRKFCWSQRFVNKWDLMRQLIV